MIDFLAKKVSKYIPSLYAMEYLGGAITSESTLESVTKLINHTNEIALELGSGDLYIDTSYWVNGWLTSPKGTITLYKLAKVNEAGELEYIMPNETGELPFITKNKEDSNANVLIPDVPFGYYYIVYITEDGTAYTTTGAHLNASINEIELSLDNPIKRPAKPTNVKAENSASGDSIVVSWSKQYPYGDRYIVKRDGGEIGSQDDFWTWFIDKNVEANKQYCYTVKAENIAGDSGDTDSVCVTTPATVANLQLTSNLKITSPRPSPASYYSDETMTAEFTITNQGGQSITLDELFIGGRFGSDIFGGGCPSSNNACPDFTPKLSSKPLNPGQSFTYIGSFTPTQIGNYKFTPVYRIGSTWNTNIPVTTGVIGTLDITVNEKPVAPTTPYDFATDATPKEMVAPQCQNKACTKTRRITNTGTTTWNTGYKLVYDSGYQMGGASVSIPSAVAPEGTKDITVNLTAPDTSGTFNGYWRLQNSSGIKFGEKLLVQIVVPDAVTNTVTTPKDGDLIQATGSPKVYLVKGGRKWWIKNETIFAAMSYNWDVKKEYPASTVDAILSGPTIVDNGSFIRVTGYPQVYLIQNGQKRWITDIPTFTGNGLKWEDVIEVTSAVGDMYPRGADITSPPRVMVISPNSGDSLTTGTPYSILWSAVDDCDLCSPVIASIGIHYSTNGGTSWSPLTTGLSNSGSYQWTPTTASSSMKIKVVATDGSGITGEAMSNAFSVNTVYTYADLTINSLSLSATTVDKGQQITATTNVSNLGNGASGATNVKYYFSSTSTGKDVYLGQSSLPSLTANGSTTLTANITIPSTAGLTGYIVAVANPDNAISESTGGNNTASASVIIKDSVAPTITYLSLPSYSFFKTGGKYSIVFEASDNIGVQSTGFYYSTDNVNWTTITSYFIPGSNGLSNGYEWTVPTTLSTPGNIYIKMIARDASGNSVEKIAGPYTLKDGTAPGVTLLSPNGGEVWDLNSSQTITWNVNSPNGISKLRLYLYWGSSAEFIADVTTNTTGSYSWTVSNSSSFVTNGARIKIRLEDLNGNTNEDWSDNYFTIRDASAPPPAPWTTPAVITSGGVSSPRIVADKNGGLHMLYSNGVYKKLTGTSWSSPVTIDGSGLASQSDIAVDSNGYPHIVYNKGIGGYSDITNYNQDDIYYSYYNGSDWSAPVNISNSIIGSDGRATASGIPSITIDPSNNVHIVWRDGYSWNSNYTVTGTSNIYYKKKDSSGNWSSVLQVTTSGGGEPSIISDTIGNLHLVYTFDSNKIAYIKWNGTAWLSPVTISTTSYGLIDVAVDKNNNPHAVWFYNDSTDGQQILYSYHDGAAWSTPEKVSNAALEGNPLRPSIVVDSSNRRHVIYEENKNKSRILYKYKDSNGWSSPTQINLSSQSVEQYSSDMAISPDDNIHVVYNSNGEVFYNHADVSGIDISSPTVSVTSPSTGSTLSIGSTGNITWSATDNTDVTSITLEYSTDGGSSYTLIASGEANDGAYEWTVPNIASSNAIIRITASDAEGNQGVGLSGAFSISDKTAPSIILTSPNGGESLTAGSQKTIQWTSNDNVGASNVDIYLSVDNGASWSSLASGMSNTGSYTWTVPTTPSSAARIKVVIKDNAGNMGQDQSDWNFAISSGNRPPNTPAVTSPANGLSNASINALLSWTGGDPDTGDTVTYDVYFGTSSNPPLISSGQGETYFNPGTLSYGSVYYWKVVATDSNGSVTTSPVWYFVTELPDTLQPTGTIAINSDAVYTKSTAVTLTLSCADSGGCAEMQISITGDNGGGATTWLPFSSTYDLSLSGNDGVYIVTVQFKDAAGNVSGTYNDSIILDTTAPTTSATPAGGTFTSAQSVTLTCNDGTGSGCDKIYYSTDGLTPTTVYPGPITISETATIRFFAQDLAGNNEEVKTEAYTIDTVVPVLVLSTLSNGASTNNNTLNISGTATDNTGVQGLTINGNPVTINADGSFSHALSLNEGANVITIVATDIAGNETTDTRTITLDITAPALAISTPADNSKTAASIATVTGTIDETSIVTLTLNGSAPQYASVIGSTFTLDIVLASGINTIEVTATDTAGNTSTQSTQKRTVTYDTDKPSLAITDPAQDIKTNQGSAIIKGTVSDALTAVSVSVTIDGNTYTPTVTDGQFEQTVTFTTEKTYAISVTAADEVGNTTTVQRNIIYDVTQPVINFTTTTPTNNASQAVIGTMEEGATVTVTSVTATVGTVTYPSSTTWRVNVTGMTEGSNTITATAKDTAGNETTVAKEIVVDTIAPVTSATPVGGTYNLAQAVTLAANETAAIYYSMDGSVPSIIYTSPISIVYNKIALKFFAVDLAGNSEAVKAEVYTINSDTNAPEFSSTSPASGSSVNTASVGYSLSKAVASGKITFTRTGGTADSSPHVYNFTSSDLAAGTHSINTGLSLVNGTVYTVTFEVTDSAGKTGSVSSTNVTYDSSAASVTIISPAANSITNIAKVNYALSEDISAGDIVFTKTGGASDSMSPYTYTLSASEMTVGNHTVDTGKTLMNGSIYTVSFENIKDKAGNSTTTVSNTDVKYDITAVAITNTTPATNSIITGSTVSYALSEQALSGKITFTRTGGTADGSSPHVYNLTASDLTSGSHTVNTNLTLADGAFYTVSFDATGLVGNAATTVSNAMVYYDSNYGIGPVGNVDNISYSSKRVDGYDLIKLSIAFGSAPGDANWNPVCDMDGNSKVDGSDLIVLGNHFGEVQ